MKVIIKLKIKDKTIELTKEEAKDLAQVLSEMTGIPPIVIRESYPVYYPTYIERYRERYPQWKWDYWSTGNTSDSTPCIEAKISDSVSICWAGETADKQPVMIT